MRLAALFVFALLLFGCTQAPEQPPAQNDGQQPPQPRTCIEPYTVEVLQSAEVPYTVNETYTENETYSREALLYAGSEVKNISATRFDDDHGEFDCRAVLTVYNPNNFALYFNITFTSLTLPSPENKMHFTATNKWTNQYVAPLGTKDVMADMFFPSEYMGPYTCSVMRESVNISINQDVGVVRGTVQKTIQVNKTREVVKYKTEQVLVNVTKYRNVTC